MLDFPRFLSSSTKSKFILDFNYATIHQRNVRTPFAILNKEFWFLYKIQYEVYGNIFILATIHFWQQKFLKKECVSFWKCIWFNLTNFLTEKTKISLRRFAYFLCCRLLLYFEASLTIGVVKSFLNISLLFHSFEWFFLENEGRRSTRCQIMYKWILNKREYHQLAIPLVYISFFSQYSLIHDLVLSTCIVAFI